MILAQAFARFVFDLDGVVWAGDESIAGAPETIRALRDGGKRLCFVTNNSGRTHETYAKKLAAMGAGGSPEEIVTSADATARLLRRIVPGLRGRATFVIGGEGLTQAVAGTGARVVDATEGADCTLVVVGIDRELTYEKLRAAALAIQRGAGFVASNTDATYPAADGFEPGAGSIVAALRTATGVEPAVAGKPEAAIMEIARDRLGGAPALVVGDRLETDVAAARAIGWPAALVLTGASRVPDLAVAQVWPDFVLRRLTDVLEDRPHPEVRAASGPDLPAIATMLHAGGLMSGAAHERLGRTIVAVVDRRPVATAAWEVVGDAALLRSVAVAPERRAAGAGTLVVAGALRRIAEAGIRDVWLATADAERFFSGCGFETVPREDVPADVLEHPQVARECPSDAALMRLALRL